MRRACVALAVFSLFGLPACSHGGAGSSTTASASPQAAQTVAAVAPATASSQPSAQATGTPVTMPTPTPDPNLLSVANGTILRSYSPAALDDTNDGNLADAANGVGSEISKAAVPPYVFTFELPGVATITGFNANLRGAPDKGPIPTLTIAVSTTSATDGFKDVATFGGGDKGNSNTPQPVNVTARWVRVTANQLYDSVSASGTIAPPPAKIDPTGIYIQDAAPDKNGSFLMSGIRQGDDRARFVAVGSALSATECTQTTLTATYVGNFQGRAWSAASAGNPDRNPATFRGSINDEGTIFAGVDGSSPVYFMKTSEKPAFCVARVAGTGTRHILVLDQDPVYQLYPFDAQPPLPGYTSSAIAAGMLDASALQGVETVVTRDVCYLPKLIAPEQMKLLLDWVAAGHKLIVTGGNCGGGSDYSWLPYPLAAKGSAASSGNSSLIQTENNALGTSDKNDTAHFVDVMPLVLDTNNDLANSSSITTSDPHWCGHYFVAKTNDLNGFVQAYATSGTGLIIYNGFNNGDDGRATMQRIRQLELALPMPAGLPCSQLVSEAFLLEPSQEATFAAGSATTVRVPMQLLANQGWSGHVTLKTSGDLKATVTPAAFDIAGGTQSVTVNIPVAASTKPGVYTVTVAAANGAGKTSSASVTLTGTASLKKQITPTQKRIRIYGIHFDVDSAHIQPRSEPVIGEIAQIMHANPSWRFQVEGHTDSDGGAAYNLALSQRRAQAVVDDLVKRYKIARSRLVAKGFGLTKPVASNATDAGKAQNRRVELLRLQ